MAAARVADPLWHWLEKGGLSNHYETFSEQGITLADLSMLTMQDYNSVGVDTMPERKKLFELILALKREPDLAAVSQGLLPSGKENLPPCGSDIQSLARCDALSLHDDPMQDADGAFAVDDIAPVAAPLRSAAPNVPPAHRRRPLAPCPEEDRQERAGSGGSDEAQAGDAAAEQLRSRPGKKKGPRIRVCVRLRPPTREERERDDREVIRIDNATSSVIVAEPRTKVDLSQYMEEHRFHFDEVFQDMTNEAVYEATAKPLIQTVFEGGRATCFAYGQTGSGKTYTMLGKGTASGKGLYALAARDLFAGLAAGQYGTCNYYEIYGNRCYDLLQDRQRLECREDGKGNVVICGLTEHRVNSVQELLSIIEDGSGARAQGATSANVDSSRSHAVLTINVRAPARRAKSQDVLVGRFSFIDLAGSERGSDAATCDKVTRVEGAEINKSLLALKECIRALDQSAKHVPFRGSKLTEVLRESFAGNSRTAMIACVAPCSSACEDTLNTLRYADRVKSLTAGSKAKPADDFDTVMMMGNRGRRNGNRIVSGGGSSATHAAPARMTASRRAAPTRHAAPAVPTSPRGPGRGEHVPRSAAPDHLRLGAHGNNTPSPPHRSSGSMDSPQAGESDAMQVDDTEVCELETRHEALIETILKEEEEMIAAHRKHVDDVMEVIREEMAELNTVDQPGSSIDTYIRNLDGLLKKKMEKIGGLREKLRRFKKHLEQEEALSTHFQLRAIQGRGQE